jgi:hypothetical protein
MRWALLAIFFAPTVARADSSVPDGPGVPRPAWVRRCMDALAKARDDAGASEPAMRRAIIIPRSGLQGQLWYVDVALEHFYLFVGPRWASDEDTAWTKPVDEDGGWWVHRIAGGMELSIAWRDDRPSTVAWLRSWQRAADRCLDEYRRDQRSR